ncbi:endonuclease domain-containing protein [Leifsonia sp. NPDC058292]|uniref:endonuclease domain-containing protein n=1 Tax=Leifsonia sp. NPDC058292 TaxID=3346428 RepID=UPI0036DF87D3
MTVPSPTRAPSARGFVGHKTSDWRPVLADGIPITPPAQTWGDLAAMIPPGDLVAAGDYLVGGGSPLCTLDELILETAMRAGRRGAARAADAIRHVRVGSESPQETRLRLLLVARGLPEPELNHEIRSPAGAFLARVDLAYPGRRLAIEYEGDVHRVDLNVFRRDIARRERVEDLGWRMLRVTADDLHPDSEGRLVARVRRAITSPVRFP